MRMGSGHGDNVVQLVGCDDVMSPNHTHHCCALLVTFTRTCHVRALPATLRTRPLTASTSTQCRASDHAHKPRARCPSALPFTHLPRLCHSLPPTPRTRFARFCFAVRAAAAHPSPPKLSKTTAGKPYFHNFHIYSQTTT